MPFVKFVIKFLNLSIMMPRNWWNTTVSFKKDILKEYFLAVLKHRKQKLKMLPNSTFQRSFAR